MINDTFFLFCFLFCFCKLMGKKSEVNERERREGRRDVGSVRLDRKHTRVLVLL